MIHRLVVIAVLLSGCGLYWGSNNNDDDICASAGEVPAQQLERDPYDGACEEVNDGGSGSCGGCIPCPADPIAEPTWPSCSGPCDDLAESACLSTAGCHAAYVQSGSATTFLGCWDTLPGVQSTGTCAGLDAWTCADHDNCASVMTSGDPLSFDDCIDETSSCGGDTCADGTHCEALCPPCGSLECPCEQQCVPDTTCADTTCGPGTTCETQCDAVTGCAPACVPFGHDPGTCTGAVTCNSAPPSCPSGTTPGIADDCYTGYCIPAGECGPFDPGLCYAPATCNSAPPSCPSGTMPGVASGCYSGFCIPIADCEVPACETLTTEAACTARSDCEAAYVGSGCTCEAGTCTCQTQSFESCMTAM